MNPVDGRVHMEDTTWNTDVFTINIGEFSLSVLPYCQFVEYFQHTSADEFDLLSFYQGFS